MSSSILLVKDISESDMELVVIAVSCINNGADLIVPADQYDELMACLGNKYPIQTLVYK
jgi:hypothetical protein